MWPKRANSVQETQPPPATADLRDLMAQTGRWAVEAGYLGIEVDVEPRLKALLSDAYGRMFGTWRGELERLLPPLEAAESEFRDAQRVLAFYRERYGNGSTQLTGGSFRRFHFRLRDWCDYRAARALCSRRAPALRKLRAEADGAARRRSAAEEWRETAASALRAHYEYNRLRAAAARQAKETGNDYVETRRFVLRGTN